MTVLPYFVDFHIGLNHDKANLPDLPGKKHLSQCECRLTEFDISVYQNSQIW